jgi:hypothetical protein
VQIWLGLVPVVAYPELQAQALVAGTHWALLIHVQETWSEVEVVERSDPSQALQD